MTQRCIDGMEAELAGRRDDALALYRQAWSSRADAYDACVAAHYLARMQETAEETLRWNEEALAQASRVSDDRVRGFHASLHLNVAHSHEMLGDLASARHHYEAAAARLDEVPEGGYRDLVRGGIAGGRARVSVDD